jgi:hypothetical protein
LMRPYGFYEALVHRGAHHVALERVAPLVLAQPRDADAEDLRFGEDRTLAVRLAPRLVVHVALRVGLDLDEPRDLDVRPALRDCARAARALAARGDELVIVDRRRALGDREPQRLVVGRRVVDRALGCERGALLDSVDELQRWGAMSRGELAVRAERVSPRQSVGRVS